MKLGDLNFTSFFAAAFLYDSERNAFLLLSFLYQERDRVLPPHKSRHCFTTAEGRQKNAYSFPKINSSDFYKQRLPCVLRF